MSSPPACPPHLRQRQARGCRGTRTPTTRFLSVLQCGSSTPASSALARTFTVESQTTLRLWCLASTVRPLTFSANQRRFRPSCVSLVSPTNRSFRNHRLCSNARFQKCCSRRLRTRVPLCWMDVATTKTACSRASTGTNRVFRNRGAPSHRTWWFLKRRCVIAERGGVPL